MFVLVALYLLLFCRDITGFLSLRRSSLAASHKAERIRPNVKLTAAALDACDISSEVSRLLKLCTTMNMIKLDSDEEPDREIVDLSTKLEERYATISTTTSLQDPVHFSALDGTWRVLATSLGMSKVLPFSQMIMAQAGSHLDLIESTICNIYQHVDVTQGVYDNYIEFTVPYDFSATVLAGEDIIDGDDDKNDEKEEVREVEEEEELVLLLVTRGKILSPVLNSTRDPSLPSAIPGTTPSLLDEPRTSASNDNDDDEVTEKKDKNKEEEDLHHNRLHIEFTANQIVPFSQLAVPQSDLEQALKQTTTPSSSSSSSSSSLLQEYEVLRKALKVDDSFQLTFPMGFKGWSDVTYLDTASKSSIGEDCPVLRLMRGNNGGLYVLQKMI